MGRTIVVVDDNRDAGDSLAMLLQMEGHTVHVAYSGEEALEIVKTHQPDVALVDLGMPGINGYELARKISGMQANRVTLIAVTAWGRKEDRRRAVSAGFVLHLLKPIDIDVLQSLLTREGSEGPA